MIAKLSRREKILGLVATTVTCLALLKYGYLNLLSKDTTLITKIAEIRATLQNQKLTLEQFKNDRKPSSSNDTLQHYLNNNKQFANLLQNISHDAVSGDTRIERVTVNSVESDGSYNKISYIIDVKSSFLPLGKFIENLEKSPLMIDIHSLEIATDENDLQNVEATVGLKNYVIKE
ncbi:MAG: hypothetical protein A2Z20_11940 [Bdellovibrionales bacterium RBG_16_40_8]|nr:MAG: hypothetical protein A2Z20_11940 [Bdellovibrionales bacterium RBG_16_40_8]